MDSHLENSFPVGKIAKRTVWRSVFLLIPHSKYSAMLLKIHSYRMLFLPTGLALGFIWVGIFHGRNYPGGNCQRTNEMPIMSLEGMKFCWHKPPVRDGIHNNKAWKLGGAIRKYEKKNLIRIWPQQIIHQTVIWNISRSFEIANLKQQKKYRIYNLQKNF